MLNYTKLETARDVSRQLPQDSLAKGYGVYVDSQRDMAVEKATPSNSVRDILYRKLYPKDRRQPAEKIADIATELFGQVDEALETLASFIDHFVEQHKQTISDMNERIVILTGLVNNLTSAAQNQAAAESTIEGGEAPAIDTNQVAKTA